MTVERAKQLIEVYKQDYCSDKMIEDDQKIHTKFVRMMMDTLEKELDRNPNGVV